MMSNTQTLIHWLAHAHTRFSICKLCYIHICCVVTDALCDVLNCVYDNQCVNYIQYFFGVLIGLTIHWTRCFTSMHSEISTCFNYIWITWQSDNLAFKWCAIYRISKWHWISFRTSFNHFDWPEWQMFNISYISLECGAKRGRQLNFNKKKNNSKKSYGQMCDCDVRTIV